MSAALRSLKVNCILATMVVAIVAVITVAIAWWHHMDVLRRMEDHARLAEVRALSVLMADGAAAQPADWLAAHPEWVAIALVQVTDDVVVVDAGAGPYPIMREPEPELVMALRAPRVWQVGQLGVAAAPCRINSAPNSVLLTWWRSTAETPTAPWLALMAGVLLVGGGLGLYLVARVYRPVIWLEQAARAAAAGQSAPPDEERSVETAALHTSISTLIDRSRSSDAR